MNSQIVIRAMLHTMNMRMPTGGVSSPSVMLSVIITPKCTGSTPY